MEGILKHSSSVNKNWVIDLDGEELSIVKRHLNMSESEKMQTVLSAAKILGQCPNPKGEKKQKVGLAIGKVQSGKTSNFIALTALAFDNGYRIVIIFGGKTKVLLSQTEKRINESFDLDSREDYRYSTFSSSGDLKSYALRNSYASNKNIIITGLKEYTHIKNIKRFIKDAGLSDVPILIIDDEGDQMSLNGAVNKDEETTTYRNFKELIIDLDFSTFISVTATPQANLLIDICNILSPDFIELIQPGEKYCGFDTYHYKPETEYISIIPIRRRRGDNTPHSMLIHPSQRIRDHSIVVKKLRILIDQIKDYIESGEESALLNVERFLARGLDNLKGTVPESYSAKELITDFKNELYNTSYIVLNGQSGDEEVDYKSNRNVIVLGGTMVERGLTSAKPVFVTCSETCFTEHYAAYVKLMHGDYRMPSLIKAVDSKTREIGDEHEKEVEREITESEKELAHEYGGKPLDFNLTDLDKWANENLAPMQCDTEALDRWIAETEKNGFRYR